MTPTEERILQRILCADCWQTTWRRLDRMVPSSDHPDCGLDGSPSLPKCARCNEHILSDTQITLISALDGTRQGAAPFPLAIDTSTSWHEHAIEVRFEAGREVLFCKCGQEW
jgi:hypothetical protein